ncbi:MAG TPA: carboxymuconolactone decarboxylase family protein [Novosphingobium sp.]
MSGLLDPAERSARGAALRADITGQTDTPADLWDESWRDFIFAEVWSRPGLDRRARYLVAMAGAALAGAHAPTLDGYVRGALRSGTLTLAELREAALHLAVYGGWSRGGALNEAIGRAARALGLKAAETAPIRAEPWNPETRTAEGMATFEHVMTFPGGPSSSPCLEVINDFVFGELWRRPALDQRARRWITLVGVCESATEIPIKSHVHAAMASGNCTPAEMREFVVQYGIHAGWPKASAIQAVVFEMSRKVAEGLPWNG